MIMQVEYVPCSFDCTAFVGLAVFEIANQALAVTQNDGPETRAK